ncbi:unnamed protein product [Bemisia tabaci]|uniref:Transcriptional adapter 3 n=1 Tax=Bemisia tabaci TaxID=7038 RepID=A0A9P0A4Q1_BEMTA|nr:unnamed protein product [Bemisia tabaci]
MHSRSKSSLKKGSQRSKDRPCSSPTRGRESRQAISEDSSDETECSLSFPVLKPVDKSKRLPCYSAVLNKSKDEGITMEDLDGLQLELETMLSSVAVRTRTLTSEIAALNVLEEQRDKKGQLALLKIKKKKTEEKSKLNKQREISNTADTQNSSPRSKLKSNASSGKNSPPSTSQHPSTKSGEPSKMPFIPRIDTPNKFWAFVGTYCADVTPEHIQYLESLLKMQENDEELMKIPPLGEHYSKKWKEEEMDSLKNNLSPSKTPKPSKAHMENDVKDMLKKVDPSIKDLVSTPIAQRLMASLIEENVSLPLQESFSMNKVKTEGGDNGEMADSKSPTAKRLKLSNSTDEKEIKSESENMCDCTLRKIPQYHSADCFDKSVCKMLETAGILEPGTADDEENDEILKEIKNVQQQLKNISAENEKRLRELIETAKKEMTRQEIQKSLDELNDEIIDVYKKINGMKQQGETPSKKDREKAWKLLTEREKIMSSLA